MDKENNLRSHRRNIRKVNCDNFSIGNGSPLVLFAGPCVVEDISICKVIAEEAKRVCQKYGVNYVFKASYDKPDKTIPGSYRGPGWKEGLNQLRKIKEEIQVPIITDVHEKEQIPIAAEFVDVLQIPAKLSKQVDLIWAAAETGRIINIKKGMFTAPWEMKNILTRLKESDLSDKILVTERGHVFGYQMLVSDMRSLQILSQFGQPVIFDGSHPVHSNDYIIKETNLNQRDFIPPLVRSGVANGLDGIFLEIHPEPIKAKSDSMGTMGLDQLEPLIKQVVAIDRTLSL